MRYDEHHLIENLNVQSGNFMAFIPSVDLMWPESIYDEIRECWIYRIEFESKDKRVTA